MGSEMCIRDSYIGGYYFGAGALTNPLTSAALNAALLAGDSAIDQLAKTGKIDYGKVGTTGAIGGAVGAVAFFVERACTACRRVQDRLGSMETIITALVSQIQILEERVDEMERHQNQHNDAFSRELWNSRVRFYTLTLMRRLIRHQAPNNLSTMARQLRSTTSATILPWIRCSFGHTFSVVLFEANMHK